MWKKYREKLKERQAIKVCKENIEAIKSLIGDRFGELLSDGITVIMEGKTRKKVSNGDYLVKAGDAFEYLNGEGFEAGWELIN